MRASVRCPHCGTTFDAVVESPSDATPHAHSYQTLRSMQPVSAPIRDRVPTCRRCGLVSMFHEGENNLARSRYGCETFEAQEDIEGG